jgi:hypothetical protein
MVDPCDDERFAALTAAHRDWLSAVVPFVDHECAGTVTCRLPLPLAWRLFDAFAGRDQDDPAAAPGEIHDLVGEFANMMCGSWLTRAANQRTFTLGQPQVGAGAAPVAPGVGLSVAIDDQPCLIAIEFTRTPEPAVTHWSETT